MPETQDGGDGKGTCPPNLFTISGTRWHYKEIRVTFDTYFVNLLKVLNDLNVAVYNTRREVFSRRLQTGSKESGAVGTSKQDDVF
ncbi:MAG: hypothetical protein LBV28_01995 [Puniceicoccales bacterium]|jgi:hypothetical protein|nr:hypothetical protein [Puniceicoccales bacterium]